MDDNYIFICIGLLHHRRETEVKDILVCFSEHIFSTLELTFSVSAGSKRRTISMHDLITAVDDGEDILDGNNIDYTTLLPSMLPDIGSCILLDCTLETALAPFLFARAKNLVASTWRRHHSHKSRRPQRSTILTQSNPAAPSPLES